MAGHGEFEHEQDDRQADEQQAGDVERQAAEADEREDQRDPAQDPGDEVGALELEEQPVEAERQQDERDVRVGQQVQEPCNGFIESSANGASASASVIGWRRR